MLWRKVFLVLGVFLKEGGVRGAGGLSRWSSARKAAFRAGCRVAERPVPEIEWTDGRGSPRPRRSLAGGRGSVPGWAQTRRLAAAQPSLPSLPAPALPRSRAAATCAPGRGLDLEALREAGPGLAHVSWGPKWPRTAKVTSGGRCRTVGSGQNSPRGWGKQRKANLTGALGRTGHYLTPKDLTDSVRLFLTH